MPLSLQLCRRSVRAWFTCSAWPRPSPALSHRADSSALLRFFKQLALSLNASPAHHGAGPPSASAFTPRAFSPRHALALGAPRLARQDRPGNFARARPQSLDDLRQLRGDRPAQAAAPLRMVRVALVSPYAGPLPRQRRNYPLTCGTKRLCQSKCRPPGGDLYASGRNCLREGTNRPMRYRSGWGSRPRLAEIQDAARSTVICAAAG